MTSQSFCKVTYGMLRDYKLSRTLRVVRLSAKCKEVSDKCMLSHNTRLAGPRPAASRKTL